MFPVPAWASNLLEGSLIVIWLIILLCLRANNYLYILCVRNYNFLHHKCSKYYSFNGARSYFLSDEDFVGSVNSGR